MAEKTTQQQAQELKVLLVDYAKQETIDPLKGVLRSLGVGLFGAVCFGFAVTFGAIGLLRMLQTEGPESWHHNGWSQVVPYLIVLVALAIGGVLTWTLGTNLKKSKAKSTAKPNAEDN